jgi:hypothetical protein
VKAGKLTKYTVRKFTLTEIADTEFHYFDAGSSFIVQYKTTGTAGFYKTDTMTWGNSGPVKTAITPALITINANEFKWFYSEMFGGVSFVGGQAFVTARQEQIVLPTASDFGGGSGIALKCLNRCLKGPITDISTAYNSPFETEPVNLGAALDYYFEKSSMKLFKGTDNTAGNEVKLNAGLSFSDSGSKFTWGVESGAMILSSVNTGGWTSQWDVYSTEGGTYYQYRMGQNSWDKLILVSNASGPLTFEDPLVIDYTHTTANDRNADATFNGKKFLLRYRGLGQVDGLPWDQIDRDGDGTSDMWVPRVALKDGILMTSAGVNYRIKALFGEKTLTNTGADCSSLATLSLPATAVPSAVTENSSNGSTTKPDFGTCIYANDTKTATGCN